MDYFKKSVRTGHGIMTVTLEELLSLLKHLAHNGMILKREVRRALLGIMGRSVAAGVGFVLVTSEEMQTLRRNLLAKSATAEDRGRVFCKDCLAQYQRQRHQAQNWVQRTVIQRVQRRVNFVSRKAYDQLHQELAELKSRQYHNR